MKKNFKEKLGKSLMFPQKSVTGQPRAVVPVSAPFRKDIHIVRTQNYNWRKRFASWAEVTGTEWAA